MPDPQSWRPFNVIVDKTDKKHPKLYLHDQVRQGWMDDNTSRVWADELKKIGDEAEQITVNINSLGGSAWDGIAIYNLLNDHKATVDVVITGMAASAASVIAMAGDTVTMRTGSQMMIHDASGICVGNAADMRKTGDALDVCSDSIADIYAKHAGGTSAEWRTRMRDETWLTVKQAIGLGLADEEDTDVQDETTNTADMSPAAMITYSPEALKAWSLPSGLVPTNSITMLPGTVPEEKQEEGTTMNLVLEALLNRLGLQEDATADEAVAALEALVAAQQMTPPKGSMLVDEAAYAALQEQVALGAEAHAELAKQRRDGILADALREGRIIPSSTETWRAALEKDEATVTGLLKSFPKNTINVTEVGHQDITGVNPDEALYYKLFGTDTKEA